MSAVQKFKQQLRSFEETISTQSNRNKSEDDNVMGMFTDKKLVCFKCHEEGHKANRCPKRGKLPNMNKKGGGQSQQTDNRNPSNSKYCGHCKTTTHFESNCRKLKALADKANAAKSSQDEQKHVFFKLEDTVITDDDCTSK